MNFEFEARQLYEKGKEIQVTEWLEKCTVSQLKELCRASKVPVSGTKPELCHRLLKDDFASEMALERKGYLQKLLKDKKLVQSGNKYDLILRLIYNEKGTGAVKRAATEIIVDDVTGKEMEVLKKRKVIPKPSTMYTRIEKKIKASSQKKYNSNYGSKGHVKDVFDMIKNLLDEYCIQSKIISTDPMLAFEVSKAGFQALYDHWQHMIRPGYGQFESKRAFSKLEYILDAIRDTLSNEQVEDMVVVLENVDACCRGYGVNESYELDSNNHIDYKKKYNTIEKVIRVIMPEYDREKRTNKPKMKYLESELATIAWMNGFTYPSKKNNTNE